MQAARTHGTGLSVTDATVNAWLERTRGMKCTPKNVARVCRGDIVLYLDKHNDSRHTVTVVNVGPLVPNTDGIGEPASITIVFDDGHERNTTLQHITPLD